MRCLVSIHIHYTELLKRCNKNRVKEVFDKWIFRLWEEASLMFLSHRLCCVAACCIIPETPYLWNPLHCRSHNWILHGSQGSPRGQMDWDTAHRWIDVVIHNILKVFALTRNTNAKSLCNQCSFKCLLISKVASWFLSPVLSGIMSGVLFYFVRKFILNKVSVKLKLTSGHGWLWV